MGESPPTGQWQAPRARTHDFESGEHARRPIALVVIPVVLALLSVVSAVVFGSLLQSILVVHGQFGWAVTPVTRVAALTAWIWWLLASAATFIAIWAGILGTAPPARVRALRFAVRGLVIGVSLTAAFFVIVTFLALVQSPAAGLEGD